MAIKPTTGKAAESTETENTSQDRRRLLKLGAYIPPAIVGMAIISGMPGTAHASKPGSCMPSACQPCIDYDDENHGSKNKNSEQDHQKKKVQCEIEKVKKDYNDKHKK